MKKVFDQTVRDLKREVNKKVLKVPGIEQKVLDATSNEPWGPHGSLLADIAHATRNYHEYQIIMHVIWKRLNDTGKNWRHVYKALTVLEYLVGHGSERVIDDIREHAYQISTLSDFQYIDSSGKDQGSNVRRKSQSLVTLVNDKEKIQEVRQKALINKDKYRSTFATGGRSPYSGSGSNGDRCDEDRYEGRYRDSYEGRYRDDDRNGYGRDRDWGSKDDEIYGRGSDPYNRDGDRYGRDSDDRYGRDSYRDDENRGGRGNGYSQFGPRNRSFDRDRDQFFEEDDRYSSRGGRVEEQSQDGRRLERKLSEQSPPPSYEETVKAAHGQVQDRRSVESAVPSGTEVYSPPTAKEISPMSTNQHPDQSAAGVSASASNKEADGFDEFDPRGSIPAVSASVSGSGVDLFGDQSASVPIHSMALVPVDFAPTLEAEAPVYSGVGTNFVPLSSASTALSQPGEDPFGDGPFRATAQGDFQAQQHGFAPATSFQPSSNMVHGAAVEPPAPGAPKVENALSFDFGDTLGGLTYTPNTVNGHHHFASNPPSVGNEFLVGQVNDGTFDGIQTSGPSSFVPPHAFQQPVYPTNMHPTNVNYLPQPGPLGTSAPRPAAQSVHAPYMQPTPMSLHTQPGLSLQPTTQTVHTALGAQPPKDKFETKSTVWSDTLNRGLVNLNISGAKVNPLADIGVDFDAINRMDKRKERSSAAPVTSTITMGKAMGSGSGIGRATAGGIVPPPNPMMGSNTGMGMGRGMGMGGYGMGMNPPMGMGMGMNMNMNMGMNQEAPMRPPAQVPGMGMGGYGTQPPYGGGYR